MHVCNSACGPVDCPVIWTGPPRRAMIRVLQGLGYKDSQDRLYYRTSTWEGWRRLRTTEDYARLNAAIDAHRVGLGICA
jgi:hypothetical protein